MSTFVRIFSFALCFTILLCVAGCGKKVVLSSISGKVTLGGEPFGAGSIRFIETKSGTGGVGYLNEDGTYKIISPIPVGEYKVHIGGFRPLAPGEKDTRVMPSYPKKYGNQKTSGWTYNVVDGENIANFDMEK